MFNIDYDNHNMNYDYKLQLPQSCSWLTGYCYIPNVSLQ